jgi:hypothetical integral membrane protein (TIGR02206 family)
MFDDLFGLDYQGRPFLIFSAEHVLPLVAIVAACALIAWLAPRLSARGSSWLRWGLAGFALANALAWDIWQRANGIWTLAYSLPLHLCTFAVPFAALMLATRRYRFYEVLYFWGFAGATQALLTPDLTANGYNLPHFVYWIFWTSHGVILWAVVYAAAACGFRPTWGSVGRAIIATNAYMILVGLVNWLTGGNYMFIARKPQFASLLDALGPWPWYLLALEAIGVIAFVVAYLPYAIRDRLRGNGARGREDTGGTALRA